MFCTFSGVLVVNIFLPASVTFNWASIPGTENAAFFWMAFLNIYRICFSSSSLNLLHFPQYVRPSSELDNVVTPILGIPWGGDLGLGDVTVVAVNCVGCHGSSVGKQIIVILAT